MNRKRMVELGLVRTALFVPGDRPDRIDKAIVSDSDVVIIDLEEAVPLAQKKFARLKVREKLIQHTGRKIIVRVNALSSGFLQEDLYELATDHLSCIMLPKIESAADIQEINRLLLYAEDKKRINKSTISIIPLVESAKALQEVYHIVSEKITPRKIFTAAFGAADYTLDLGINTTEDGVELIYARSRIAIACCAAGVAPPLDTPYMVNIHDESGLKADAKRAKQLGFQGKLCIHPSQVGPCNAVFSPTAEEVDYARRIIAVFEEAETKGMAVIQLDGKFIDRPVVERSRRIVQSATFIK